MYKVTIEAPGYKAEMTFKDEHKMNTYLRGVRKISNEGITVNIDSTNGGEPRNP